MLSSFCCDSLFFAFFYFGFSLCGWNRGSIFGVVFYLDKWGWLLSFFFGVVLGWYNIRYLVCCMFLVEVVFLFFKVIGSWERGSGFRFRFGLGSCLFLVFEGLFCFCFYSYRAWREMWKGMFFCIEYISYRWVWVRDRV